MKTLEAQVPEILQDEVIELAAKQHTSADQIVSRYRRGKTGRMIIYGR